MDDIVHVALAEITKTEKTPSGTLLVYGKAAGDGLDRDLQRLDMGWLKTAMPKWFTSGANVREMHQPIAAGKGIELEEKTDGYYVLSEAVDPVTISKLEKGILTGYSVGIKRPQLIKDATAPKGRIAGGDIIELSYADRPSDPTNKVDIVKMATSGELEPTDQLKTIEPDAEKREFSDDEREALAKEGKAMPDGSYPTPDKSAFDDAVSAFGRAKDTDAVKTYLIKRAKDEGWTDDLPEDWDGSTAEKAVAPDVAKDAWDAAMAGETVGRLRALRDQLGYPPKDSDLLIAAVIDTLISLAYSEESEAIGESGDMALYSAHPDLTKRTFYSTAEKDRVTTALQGVLKAAKEIIPDIVSRVSEEQIEDASAGAEADLPVTGGDPDAPQAVTVVEDELAGSTKAAKIDPPTAPSAEDAGGADLVKVLTGDAYKVAMADAFKVALEDGLAPVKESLDKLAGLPERMEKIEAQPAPSKVVLHPQERGTAVNDFTDADPLSALSALRDKHQGLADQAGSPVMKQAHLAKVAQIDQAIAAL